MPDSTAARSDASSAAIGTAYPDLYPQQQFLVTFDAATRSAAFQVTVPHTQWWGAILTLTDGTPYTCNELELHQNDELWFMISKSSEGGSMEASHNGITCVISDFDGRRMSMKVHNRNSTPEPIALHIIVILSEITAPIRIDPQVTLPPEK